jgi:hypothetical protein
MSSGLLILFPKTISKENNKRARNKNIIIILYSKAIY